MPRLWIQIATIIALTLAAYQHAHLGQWMPIDDGLLVTRNPIVKEADIAGAFSTYDPELYIPLTLLSYQIEYAISGDNPMGYHITNVLLHIANAILVLLLMRFFTKRWEIPFLTSLLFAIHPINTEAVMWVAARKDLLAAFFLFGSLLAYCRYRTSSTRFPFYLSAVLFLCGLLSKIIVVTLPLVLMIIDDLVPAKKLPYEKLSKWVFYLPAIVFLSIALIAKFISIYSFTYWESMLLACKSVVFTLKQILLPTHLSLFYQQTTSINLLVPEFFIPVLVLLGLILIVFESKRFGKTISLSILFFGITLLPNLANASKGFDTFYASDRYAYIPCIGILFLISTGLVSLFDRFSGIKKHIMIFIMIALPCTFALQAHRYSIMWLTPETYFERIVRHYPQTPTAHTLLGLTYLKHDDLPSAMHHFETALKDASHSTVARAHLGLAQIKSGNIDKGLKNLKQIKRTYLKQHYVYTYKALGYIAKGNDDIAEGLLGQTLTLKPDDSTALQLMGAIVERNGETTDAQEYYSKALQADPNDLRIKAALVKLLKSQS